MAQNHRLPSELYDQISECLQRRDLASFARTSQLARVSAMRSLYRRIVLQKTTQLIALKGLCHTLSQHRHLAELVTHLEIDYTPPRSVPPDGSLPQMSEYAKWVASALQCTTNLQHLSLSPTFTTADDIFAPDSPRLPQLRHLHLYSGHVSLTPGLSSFLTRHSESLQELTLFSLSRTCDVVAVPQLNRLQSLTTDSLHMLVSVFFATRRRNLLSSVRRIDFGTRLVGTLLNLNQLQAVARRLEQINFLQSFRLSESFSVRLSLYPWSAIKRFGMRWCVAGDLTVNTLRILDKARQAFPALEAVDLFCGHPATSKTHSWVNIDKQHDLTAQLLQFLEKLPRLRLVTVLHTAFVRDVAGTTFRSDGPLQRRHGAPEIPFNYL